MHTARDQYVAINGQDDWEENGSGAAAGYQIVSFLRGGLAAPGADLTRERFRAAIADYAGYSDLITSERHLFGAIRYVALNPVKAGMCPVPENWPWSSYRASAGLEFPIDYLALPQLLRLFDSRPADAYAGYCRLVDSGRGLVSDTEREARGDEAKAGAFASQVLR